MDTTPTMVVDDRPHISAETYTFMSQEIARLTAEAEQLRGEVAYWEQQTNHWYMKANYSPAEIARFIRRRSMGLDSQNAA